MTIGKFNKVLLASSLLVAAMTAAEAQILLLDDFSGRESSYGTSWTGFTDRVMGGLSEMQAALVDTAEHGPALRMSGRVRLENNGGFIQARLPLDRGGEWLDASDYDAVRVLVRGDSGAYYLHVRTPQTRRPWQYFRAELPVDGEWQEQTIPFASFSGQSIRGDVDWSRLGSIALVAYGEAFEAELLVARIELVRRHPEQETAATMR